MMADMLEMSNCATVSLPDWPPGLAAIGSIPGRSYPKETTADDGNGRDEVDVSDLMHPGGSARVEWI